MKRRELSSKFVITMVLDPEVNNATSGNTTSVPDYIDDNAVFLVLKTIPMVIVMILAVFGNSLVILSVIKYERLRESITNYFIVSLAFADLLVAIFVMPFNASMEITEKWIFGELMCDIFNANDVLFSTASILHLCCISVDRYIAIMTPLHYKSKLTNHRVIFMIAATWISSVLISYIPIHSQFYTTNDNLEYLKTHPDACLFVVNSTYAVVSSSVSFWIPCTIMVFVYLRIFREARKQERYIRSASVVSYHEVDSLSNDNIKPKQSNGLTVGRTISERKRLYREHRAAKTLGIIMGLFILCFLPFFSWYLITSVCKSCKYPPILGTILFWVGYSNSCLNPIIYAFCNREFRQAFKKLLNWKSCKDLHRQLSSNNNSQPRKRSNSNSKEQDYVQMVFIRNGINNGNSTLL